MAEIAGSGLIGDTAMELLDSIQQEDDEYSGGEISDVFIVVAVKYPNPGPFGWTNLRYFSSNPSWIFQLGMVHAAIEAMQHHRTVQDND